MKIKRQNNNATFAQFIAGRALSFSDKKIVHDELENALKKLIDEPHRQYGFRIENMFAYVAGALGQCQLIKQEDTNGICLLPNDDINIPDYRIISNENGMFFVEVKNCADKKVVFHQSYVEQLAAYANINGTSVKFAIYWSKLKLWSLNSLSSFTFKNNKYLIPIDTALATNEMIILGDKTIATSYPLRIVLSADITSDAKRNDSGEYPFKIGSVEIYSHDTLIEDPTESNIAFQLMLAGKWEEKEDVLIENDRLISISYSFFPSEENQEREFAMLGTVSSIISSKYDSATVAAGKLEKLAPSETPEKFQVFIPENYNGKYLPLWFFYLQPNPNYKTIYSD